MIEQIGAFGDQLVAIALHRGDDGLDRLLAELLGAALRRRRRGASRSRIRRARPWRAAAMMASRSARVKAVIAQVQPHRQPGRPPYAPWPAGSCRCRNGRSRRRARRWHGRRVTPSTRWSSVPTPPDAMTGTGTASATRAGQRRDRSRSWCRRGPSRSAGSRRRRGATTSRRIGDRVDAGRLAPAMGEDLPARRAPTCLASIATTMHCAPNFSAASRDELAPVHGRGD